MDSFLVRAGIFFLLLLVILSAGCIRHLPIGNAGANETQQDSLNSAAITATTLPGNVSSGNSTAFPSAVTTPPETLEVAEVNPLPYITPDPYRLPYRDHGNWTTVDDNRVPRIPEYTKHIILRSNSTAFSVNVTKGPLVVDLTFSPQFSDPDQTKQGGDGSDDSENGVSTNSFIFSNAEVTVVDSLANVTVEKEGYNGVYSIENHKKITVYNNGSYVIALTGNFIDVNMAIITGSAREITPAPTPEYNNQEDDSFD